MRTFWGRVPRQVASRDVGAVRVRSVCAGRAGVYSLGQPQLPAVMEKAPMLAADSDGCFRASARLKAVPMTPESAIPLVSMAIPTCLTPSPNRRSVELESWTLVLCPPGNTTLPPLLDVRMVGRGGRRPRHAARGYGTRRMARMASERQHGGHHVAYGTWHVERCTWHRPDGRKAVCIAPVWRGDPANEQHLHGLACAAGSASQTQAQACLTSKLRHPSSSLAPCP